MTGRQGVGDAPIYGVALKPTMDEAEDLRAATGDVAAVLGIEPPAAGTPVDEVRAWLDWWKPSADAATRLTADQVDMLKAGGWWPPVTAVQISTLGPGRPQLSKDARPLHESSNGTRPGSHEGHS